MQQILNMVLRRLMGQAVRRGMQKIARSRATSKGSKPANLPSDPKRLRHGLRLVRRVGRF